MFNWIAASRIGMGADHAPLTNQIATGLWIWCWLVSGLYRFNAPGSHVSIYRREPVRA